MEWKLGIGWKSAMFTLSRPFPSEERLQELFCIWLEPGSYLSRKYEAAGYADRRTTRSMIDVGFRSIVHGFAGHYSDHMFHPVDRWSVRGTERYADIFLTGE